MSAWPFQWSSSRTGSTESVNSTKSEPEEVIEETILERIAALKDIIPPTTRYTIASRAVRTASLLKTLGKAAGNLVWIVTTSALLVGLPLALSLEDEAKIVQQEKEMLAQQQGAQQVRRTNFYRRFLRLFSHMSFQMIAGYPASSSQQQKGVVPPGF